MTLALALLLPLLASARWHFDPAAAGLLLVSQDGTADIAENAARRAGLAFDEYDVRAEGPLTTDVMLRYLGRSIVVPSVTNDLDAVALRQYLLNSGAVVLNLGDAPAAATGLGRLALEFRAGTSTLAVASLSASAGNQFASNAPKGLLALSTSGPATAETLARDLMTLDLMLRPFADKSAAYLAAVSGGAQERAQLARAALLYDLIREMADHAARGGGDARSVPKLSAFVELALGRQGEERRTLLLLYPELEAARRKYEKSGWFRPSPVRNVLKPFKLSYERDVTGRTGD